MDFKHLTDVHTRRHAHRVQKNLERTAVFSERHVFDRNNLGNATLVTVTTCHLVTDGEATLLRDVDLDALQNARLEFVTLRDLVDFLFHRAGQGIEVVASHEDEGKNLVLEVFVTGHERRHRGNLRHVDHGEVLFVVNLAFADQEFMGFVVHDLAGSLATEEFEQVFAAGFLDLVDLDLEIGTDVLNRFLILFLALLVGLVLLAEDAGFKNHALHSRRSLEGRITDVAGLFAEDGAEQAFFRREFGFTLRGDLTDEDIIGADFGTHADHAVFVEVAERIFADVRDFAGEFFRTALGVADFEFVFFNMDRGERILDGEFFRDDDGVFVVVAVPREEADEDVLTESQFAVIGGHAVGQHVASLDEVTHAHDGLLVDAGILVTTFELAENVFVNRILAEEFVVFTETGQRHKVAIDHVATLHGNVAGVDEGHAAVVLGTHDRTRVEGGAAFEAGTHHGGFRTEQRHSLALHVRTHQGTVSVIVFEERDEASGHGHDLHRSHVHEVDVFHVFVADGDAFLTEHVRVFALVANDDVLFGEAVVVGEFGRSRSHLEGVFFVGSEVSDKVRNDLFHDIARLDVISRTAEVVEHGAVLHEQRFAVGHLHLEHLVHEAVEEVALTVVEVHADAVHFLAGKFELHEQVRVVNEALENAEVPLFFGELHDVALGILEVDQADDAVRGLDEAEVVHHGVRCEGVDKTDVRSFRSLNRAETAIVRVVHVTDFEARAFTGKATGTESGKTALVGKFGKRVHLVHELRQLAGTEERLHHGAHHTGVHEVARSRLFVFVVERQVFANHAGHAGKTHRNLVGEEFAHGTGTAVAQVVDIVEGVTIVAVVEADHVLDNGEEVRLGHRHLGDGRHLEIGNVELFGNFLEGREDGLVVDLRVQAVTTDFAQVVLARVVEEQVVKVVLRGLQVRSFVLLLVRNGVDGAEGLFAGTGLVGREGVVDEEVFLFRGKERDLFDAAFAEAFQLLVVNDSVGFDDNFTGRFVDNVLEDDTVDKDADTVVVKLFGFFSDIDFFGLLVEEVQNVLGSLETDATEHRGSGNLLLAVDDEVKDVAFGIEFDPRTTMRNDAALVVRTAVRLEFFVEAHTIRTVQLGNDNAFRTVHDERPVFGHDREFANQDVVLDFFLEAGIFAVLLEHAECESGVELHGVSKTAFTALGDAVFRNTETVLFVFQGEQTVGVCDRENILEDAFQADLQSLFLRNVLLKELLVGSLLDFDQVRKFQVEPVGGIVFSLRCH